MATYLELNDAMSDGNLFIKIKVASFIAAQAVAVESSDVPNHAHRITWAKQVYQNPENEARRMLSAVLAANQAAPIAAIKSATDAAVLSAVMAAIDVFADGQT